MLRMSGEDAGFLAMELPHQPMCSGSVAVIVPPLDERGVTRPVTVADLRAHIADRLGEIPAFRWRLAQVPGRIHQPVLVDDPDFDLDYHLRSATLAPPGDDRQLEALFAAECAEQLDRRHPLWRITLVDGLQGGRQAVLSRIHHCLMDGVAALTIFSRIFSGVDHVPVQPAEPWCPGPVPGPARLLWAAMADRWRDCRELPPLVGRTVRHLSAARNERRRWPDPVPRPSDTPKSRFDQAFSSQRTYARASVSLADVKQVKDAAGVSLNDVALALVAGALRRVLLAEGTLPDRPLTASVPVGFEPSGAPVRSYGNRFSGLTTSLATDVEDPWRRLLVIHRTTKAARAVLDALGPDLLPDWLQQVPPILSEAAMRARHRALVRGQRPDANILVSNLRGPERRWQFGPAEVEDLHLVGPPSNGVGTNVMLWSYDGRMAFSALSFASALPDARGFTDAIEMAMDDLLAAVDARRRSPDTVCS